VLEYLHEEGMSIEPDFFVPIIPLVLVNGSEGIGTGWSSTIPQYSPLDIIANLRQRLKQPDAPFKRMAPWYRGFCGTTTYNSDKNSYTFHGEYKVTGADRLEISELPIRKWTRDYKNFLEVLA
jgi:DNA topoisomerase-2